MTPISALTPIVNPEPRRIVLRIRSVEEQKQVAPVKPVGDIIYTALTVPQYAQQQQLLLDRFSENTKRCYQEDYTQFRDYCYKKWPDVPFCLMSHENLLQHAIDMAIEGKRYSTVGRRISGVLAMIPKNDRHMFRMEEVGDHLQALRRKIGTRKKGQIPILKNDLYKMVDSIGTGYSARQVQDRALLLLTWHSAMRREESCNLLWSDLDFRDHGLIILIRSSKTDQTSEGQTVGIVERDDGYCPIKHVLQWKNFCGGTGSLWRTILGQSKILERPLQPEQLYKRIKEYCMSSGLDPVLYSPHSLRSGLITQGAKNGATVVMLQKQSRHQNASGLDPYIRDVDKLADNVGHLI